MAYVPNPYGSGYCWSSMEVYTDLSERGYFLSVAYFAQAYAITHNMHELTGVVAICVTM
jgi:hypothetical protein